MLWLNPRYEHTGTINKRAEEYKKASPFPHISLPLFLEEKAFATLFEALRKQEFFVKDADLFSFSQTNDLRSASDPVIQEFLEFLRSDQLRGMLEQITGITIQNNVVDVFGAVYEDTDYLLCHDDQLENRKIAFILYCTDVPPEQGGALALYTDKDGHPFEKVAKYQPKANTLMLFSVSEKSWHEVEEVKDGQRISIGGWYSG